MGASGLCGRDVSVKDAAVIRWLARIPRTDGFARCMATVYAAFFLFGGIQMPYLPAWLQARGLDPGEIVIALAAPMLIRIVAVPARHQADRSLRRSAVRARRCGATAQGHFSAVQGGTVAAVTNGNSSRLIISRNTSLTSRQ